MDFRVTASLSDLRELSLVTYLMGDEVVRLIDQSTTAFGEHPFGATTANPWPQFTSISVNCYSESDYFAYRRRYCRFELGGARSFITSLSLKHCTCHDDDSYVQCMQQVFRALNSKNFENLMELSISSCHLVTCIASSLATPESRQGAQQRRLPHWSPLLHDLQDQSNFVPDILRDLLTYVTKRQSLVPSGAPFLRSLSLIAPCKRSPYCEDRYRHLHKPIDTLYIDLSP